MPGTLVVLMLAVWAGTIVVFINGNRGNTLLWIPVLLALAGVFCSILPFAISPSVAVGVNGLILILFVVVLEMLGSKRRLAMVLVRHRTR